MTATISLAHLFDGMPAQWINGGAETLISSVTSNSRNVSSGTLFVACPGATSGSRDGHDFLQDAIARGAAGVVVERRAACPNRLQIPCCVVPDSRAAVARLSERIWGNPSREMAVVGVTGTNGKTTVTFLLASILNAAGLSSAVLGTLGVGPIEALRPVGFTTPEAEVLSKELRSLAEDATSHVAMEVSSHALATKRVDGIRFRAVGFTNLTQDHLDFHGDFQAYFEAKARLFRDFDVDDSRIVLAARDEPWSNELRRRHPDARTWGSEPQAYVRARAIEPSAEGVRFELQIGAQSVPARTSLIGMPNLENLLCAVALADTLGVDIYAIAQGIEAARTAPGRMQRVNLPGAGAPTVIVDYAHTPDALERALLTCRSLTGGNVTVVFGCGGDRDRSKRQLMGRVASQLADIVVLTDDNPRSESPAAILDAIQSGIRDMRIVGEGALAPKTCARVHDRSLAIRVALEHAQARDVVLIAGKGHEQTQTIGTSSLPFDDVQVATKMWGELA